MKTEAGSIVSQHRVGLIQVKLKTLNIMCKIVQIHKNRKSRQVYCTVYSMYNMRLALTSRFNQKAGPCIMLEHLYNVHVQHVPVGTNQLRI